MHEALNTFESPEMHESLWADAANMGTCGECEKWHDLNKPCPIEVDEQEIDCEHCHKIHKEGDCPYAIRSQLPDLSKFDSKERNLTSNTEISQSIMTEQTTSQSDKSEYTTANTSKVESKQKTTVTPANTGTYRGTVGQGSDSYSESEKEENKKHPSDKHTDDEEEESEEAQELRAHAEKRALLRQEKKAIKENDARGLELIQALQRFKQTGIKPNLQVTPN